MNRFESRFMATPKDDVLELFIYGQIGSNFMSEGVDESQVAAALRQNKDAKRISVRINSPGGSVAKGSAIYSLLTTAGKPVDVIVDGFAGSAAFTVAMAGDTISISEAGRMMLHNAWGMCMGEAEDMEKEAALLRDLSEQMAGIYAKRSGLDLSEVQAMMQAETYLSPAQAVAKGFANTIIKATAGVSAKAEAAKWDMSMFARSVPDDLKQSMKCLCPCPACAAGDCTSCTNEDCDDPYCDDQQDPVAVDYSLHERRRQLAGLTL